jgi:hypothetical protein
MVSKINLSEDTISLLNQGSVLKEAGGETYYFLPFWFKRIGNTNEFEMNALGKLPKKLQDLITSKRNGCQEK